jgi:hypothetical protein
MKSGTMGQRLRVLREFRDKELNDAMAAALEEDRELLKQLVKV